MAVASFKITMLCAVAFAGSAPAFAQTEIVQPGNPDADRLANEMRILAADPRDMNALLAAREFSFLQVGGKQFIQMTPPQDGFAKERAAAGSERIAIRSRTR